MRGKPGTKAEQARKDACRALGCIACIIDGAAAGYRWEDRVDIHHMLDGNKKIGEWATVPLCDPHHVGPDLSWHRTRRAFRARYGADLVLIETTNLALQGTMP